MSHLRGEMTTKELDGLYDKVVCETIAKFEATGSPVVNDGEQAKKSLKISLPVMWLDTTSFSLARRYTRVVWQHR